MRVAKYLTVTAILFNLLLAGFFFGVFLVTGENLSFVLIDLAMAGVLSIMFTEIK